jgi:glycosyltransferase involved in cell wall biosynthesis
LKPCRSICLIAGGLVDRNLRLQPWRYLSEVALQLGAQGYKVTIISDDVSPGLSQKENGIHCQLVPSVSNPWWWINQALQQAIQRLNPDIILWHIGLTNFLHQRLDSGSQTPIVGIFTSPLYSRRELGRIGIKKLITGYQLGAVHLLGALAPRRLLRRFELKNNQIHSLVVQTQTTGQQLRQERLWSKPITVIKPGVDEVWRQPVERDETRARLGYGHTDKVVVYFGSPAPLRGLHTLIQGFEMAYRADAALKLLILSRRRVDELLNEETGLKRLLSRPQVSDAVQIVSGYLEQEQMVKYVVAGDIVALPFELVPSDAPLSVLEAQALGKPVVTTRVACLPELAAGGVNCLAQPADPVSLAVALTQAKALAGVQNLSGLNSRSWPQMGEEWSQFIENVLCRN